MNFVYKQHTVCEILTSILIFYILHIMTCGDLRINLYYKDGLTMFLKSCGCSFLTRLHNLSFVLSVSGLCSSRLLPYHWVHGALNVQMTHLILWRASIWR
jgi:hypothetical protein